VVAHGDGDEFALGPWASFHPGPATDAD
jgi:hypothetical protein